MDIFTSLTNDHRLITRVLGALESFVVAAEISGALDLVELNRFCVFLREFVELSHHDVEEEVLLPAMEAIGYAHNGAPLAQIRDDHDKESALLLDLRRSAVKLTALSTAEKTHVLRTGRDLVSFQRAHMKKEDELLYPAVEKELTSRRLADLNRSASKRRAATRTTEQIWLRSLADELILQHPPGESEPPWAQKVLGRPPV